MSANDQLRLAAEAIEQFFASVMLASLELPDGWFGGRRGENLHELTCVCARSHRLLVELDGQLLLSISGTPLVTSENGEVVITGFDQLVFDWQSYGDLRPQARVFDSGAVRLVAQ